MHNFRKVLRTVLLFLLVVLLISVAFMEVYFRTERGSFQDGSDRDAVAGTLDTLVCGASHAYRDFNPAVMDARLGTRTYNISGSLMTMQGRWELLREEIDRNPVKTVVLELSYNTMTRNREREGTEGDLYVMARLSSFFHRVRFFFTGFRLNELPSVYYKFLTEGIDTTIELAEGKPGHPNKRIQGYLPTGPRTSKLNTKYESLFHQAKAIKTAIDPYNETYLNKILKLCEEKGVRVILVTTPITKSFLCRYNNFDVSLSYYRKLAEEHGYDFFDFNLYREKEELFPDKTMFYDITHLNPDGADRFSELYAEILQAKDRGEDVSDRFYESYAEMQAAWGY